MKKDFKKIELLKINARKIFSGASSEAFTEICQKLKLNRKKKLSKYLL